MPVLSLADVGIFYPKNNDISTGHIYEKCVYSTEYTYQYTYIPEGWICVFPLNYNQMIYKMIALTVYIVDAQN